MNKQEKTLLGLQMFDAVLGSWFSIWWIKVFSEMLSGETLSTAQIIRNASSIVVIYFVIKKYENPSPVAVVGIALFTYTGLFTLMVSPEVFWLVSTFLSVFCSAVAGTFITSLKAQNINGARRNQYDNRENLIFNIGAMIGGGLALVFLAEDIPYWFVWLMTFMIFDIDMWIRFFLVKKGFFKYDRSYNVNEFCLHAKANTN